MTADLLALAERVEAATGADRELDGAVRRVVVGDFGLCGDEGWLCSACSLPAHELTQEPGCGCPLGLSDERHSYPCNWQDDERLPAYTVSLDAAMTLVPAGMGFNLNRYWLLSKSDPVWMSEIASGGIPSNPRQVHASEDCHNASLAVTAAALRALASQEADDAA